MNSYPKGLISILLALLLIVSILPLAALSLGEPEGSDPEDWYMSVEGVLGEDRYHLYPYEKKSLNFGFSRFGEIINGRDDINIGLEYGDRDAFAPSAGPSIPTKIPKNSMQSGWLINITYFNIPEGEVRNIWACALFSDFYSAGNGWIRVDDDWMGGVPGGPEAEDKENPKMPGRFIDDPAVYGYGGRKTNGTAVTEPIEVLYDGPRRFIARVVNHVYDWVQTGIEDGYDEPLVDVVMTIDFDKVKKEIVVMNDLKLVSEEFVIGTMDVPIYEWMPYEGEAPGSWATVTKTIDGLIVQFSNRGRWDIGESQEFESYVHFYTEGDDINPLNPSYTDDLVAEGLATVYNEEYTMTDTLPQNLLSRHGQEPRGIDSLDSTFDLAQVISDDGEYVGWAAFWPSLSDWSADAERLDQWWRSLTIYDTHAIDGITSEPFRSPYIVGEWDFILRDEPALLGDDVRCDRQFRGVTVYGLTDRHESPSQVDWTWDPNHIEVGDGSDLEITSSYSRVDREVAYQLMEVFNPWDLSDVIQKDSSRWVELGQGLGYVDEKYGSDLIAPPFDFGETYDYVYLEMTETYPFYSYAYDGDGVIGWNNAAHGPDSFEVGEWFAYSTFPERVFLELDPGVPTLLERGRDYLIYLDYLDANHAYVVFIEDGDPEEPLEIKEDESIKVIYSTWKGIGPAELGRSYEWVVTGRDSEVVDSLGASMVTEALDLKGISVKETALDIYAPDMPFLLRNFGLGDYPSDYYYSGTDFRLALKEDWSSTLPIASSNIITVGGPLANVVTEYFNDFTQVIYREDEDDLLLVSDWGATFYGPMRKYSLNTTLEGTLTTDLGRAGIGIISTYKDINGTEGFVVYGYNGEDTLWTSRALNTTLPIFLDDGNGELDWTDENDDGLMDPEDAIEGRYFCPKLGYEVYGWWFNSGTHYDLLFGYVVEEDKGELKWLFVPGIEVLQMENPGVTSIVLLIYYDIPQSDSTQDPNPVFLLVEELGTISEKPKHPTS